MFTGIIEQLGKIEGISKENGNIRLKVKADFTPELKIDQSVAHNGICLTVVHLFEDSYEVVAIQETILKTSIGNWQASQYLNLERCMVLNSRLDGHIVQGHVDQVAEVIKLIEQNGSWVYTFRLSKPEKLIVEKGSITVNGVSLTAFDVSDESFSVAIIPFTHEHTTFQYLSLGDLVNLEFDIIGKYVQRLNS